MALGHADASFSENQNNIGSEHKGLSSASLERANLQPSVGQRTPKRSGGTRCEKHTRLKQRVRHNSTYPSIDVSNLSLVCW